MSIASQIPKLGDLSRILPNCSNPRHNIYLVIFIPVLWKKSYWCEKIVKNVTLALCWQRAEKHGFTLSELTVALELACTADPLDWLTSEWRNLVLRLGSAAWGRGGADSGFGRVSGRELRQCMLACGGCAHDALRMCVRQRNAHVSGSSRNATELVART